MPIPVTSITGLILAGGGATRMGGLDKGLQTLHGKPLAVHVLERLAPQTGALVISANRHCDEYAVLGAPWRAAVVADANWPANAPAHPSSDPSSGSLPSFDGPLAGLLAGMRAARTDWLLMAPCDSPYLPVDLAARLGAALHASRADIATVCTINTSSISNTSSTSSKITLHPVFALLRTALADDLAASLAKGERKVRAWYARHNTAEVPFADERAFYNINSLRELAGLERTPQQQ